MRSENQKILPFDLIHESRRTDYLSKAQDLFDQGILPNFDSVEKAAEKLYILDESKKNETS